MRKVISIVLAAAIVAITAFISQPALQVQADKPAVILQFSTMVGVLTPYTGSTNPIRGIHGGGLPWVIRSAQGNLNAAGELEVKVRGLVLADDPSVPANLRETNPVAMFKVIASCLSVDAAGSAVTVNVSTATFPATTGPEDRGGGNASIETHISLPKPCIAPILFVTSPTGAWFAATGF